VTDWEEKLGNLLIQKGFEFLEIRGSIDGEKIKIFLREGAEAWYDGKFRD
jgi:hypothetical protein